MSSQSPLSTLSRTPSVPLRVPSHSSPSTLPPYPSPSLYVTFKVLRLVNTFRQRVKTRVQSGRGLKKATPTRNAPDFCQDFERQAFEEIDRYLGRNSTVRTRKRGYPTDLLTAEGGGKPYQAKRSTVATVSAIERSETAQSVQWLLDEFNQSVKSNGREIVTVAKHHELFVGRKDDFEIKQLSVKELVQHLVTVRDLLSTLRRDRLRRSLVRTLAEGNELLDLSLDESQTANLEHLLLCLKDQLTKLLISRVVGLVRKHLVECQHDRTRHCEDWFFEFPDARHPLSTTWPWSIRPSLAVLWGVCWMFYDCPTTYDFFSDDDVFATYSEAAQSMLQYAPTTPQQFSFYPGQANLLHAPTTDRRLPRQFPTSHNPRSGCQGMMTTQPHRPQHRGLAAGASSHPFYVSTTGPPDQAAHASEGLAGDHYLYSSAAAPRSSYAPAPAQPDTSQPNWLVPEVNFHHQQHLSFAHDSTQQADDGRAWDSLAGRIPSGQQHFDQTSWSYPPADLPPHPRNPSAPAIKLSTQSAQPQDFNSAPLSSSSTHPLHESPYRQAYSPSHLSPQAARGNFMNPDEKHMNTPPRSPLPAQAAAAMGEQLSRKRSHEQMVDASGVQHVDHHSGGHSRTGSVSSQHLDHSAGEGDAFSPKTRTIKRSDAPMNDQGKYICTYAPECHDQIFDRKCEWSKHMDKHDRPYRCHHAECAKLQGFTYSGGLLRHEREVHNKHGGPKAQLICPHEDCKRHGGKGFTRRENLNEHLRRVHQGRDPQSQGFSQPDMNGGAEDMHPPYFTHPTQEDAESPVHKRRRYTQGASDRSASEGIEDLRQEVVRLREDNSNKETEMDRMRGELEELRQIVQLMRDTQAPQPSHQSQTGMV